MKTDLHLVFPGTCRDAFAFYEKTFHTKIQFTMTYAEAPDGSPAPPDSDHLILHTSMALGNAILMGCDAPKGREATLGGFQISLADPNPTEITRLFHELQAGGTIQLPLGPTFWSPLFGMCTDKFGVGWMLSIPGPQL
jgi:PhnB protein